MKKYIVLLISIAADMQRASHWATIGVGVAGYYQR